MRDEGSPVEFVNWKGRIAITAFEPPPPPSLEATRHTQEPAERCSCYFAETGRVDTAIFRGGMLQPGAEIAGPAIIEEPTTTIVIPPGFAARLSAAGNYILDCAA